MILVNTQSKRIVSKSTSIRYSCEPYANNQTDQTAGIIPEMHFKKKLDLDIHSNYRRSNLAESKVDSNNKLPTLETASSIPKSSLQFISKSISRHNPQSLTTIRQNNELLLQAPDGLKSSTGLRDNRYMGDLELSNIKRIQSIEENFSKDQLSISQVCSVQHKSILLNRSTNGKYKNKKESPGKEQKRVQFSIDSGILDFLK